MASSTDQMMSLIWNAPSPCWSRKCETWTSAASAIVSPRQDYFCGGEGMSAAAPREAALRRGTMPVTAAPNKIRRSQARPFLRAAAAARSCKRLGELAVLEARRLILEGRAVASRAVGNAAHHRFGQFLQRHHQPERAVHLRRRILAVE